jgi:hypothetical protein
LSSKICCELERSCGVTLVSETQEKACRMERTFDRIARVVRQNVRSNDTAPAPGP